MLRERFQTIRCSAAVATVALLTAVAALAAAPAQAVTNCTPSSSWGSNRADLASQVVSLINQHRAGMGLSQLGISSTLAASSEWKSLHMAANGYFDHNDPAPPVSRTASQRVKDCGYGGGSWGENIAWGYASAQAVVNGWLGSSGHKANIENPAFTSTGVGVAANTGGQLYWTQNFGTDVPAATPPPPATPAPAATPPATPALPASAPSAAVPAAAAPTTSVNAAPAAPARAAASTPSATEFRVGAKPAHVLRQTKRSRLVASVTFVHLVTGRPFASGSVRCRAEVEGKRLRVLANAFKAQSARCAWRIPGWAKGKQLTGVVAVQVGNAAATRLFMRALE
jgi:uncharacterized protein YkwD